MEIKRDKSKYYVMSESVFATEKLRDMDKKRNYKLIKKYKSYDLYEHKKYGFKECFYK